MSKRILWLSASSLLFLAGPAGANAQNVGEVAAARVPQPRPRFYVNPQFGMYLPIRPLVADETLKLRNVGALAIGTRVGYQVTSRVSLESSVIWTPSQVARSNWNSTIDLQGALAAAGAELRVLIGTVTTKTEEYSFYASGGAGLVRRTGTAWEHTNGVTHPAGIVRGFINYRPVSGRIAYTAEVQNFLSRTAYRSALGTSHAGRVHHDVMITFGASFPLRRHNPR